MKECGKCQIMYLGMCPGVEPIELEISGCEDFREMSVAETCPVCDAAHCEACHLGKYRKK